MTPCAKNKRRIAWLASGVLGAADAETLRQHLESCPGCRHYWQGMTDLSERLVNASTLPDAEPTPSFHRRIVQGINAVEKDKPFFVSVNALRTLWAGRRIAAVVACIFL